MNEQEMKKNFSSFEAQHQQLSNECTPIVNGNNVQANDIDRQIVPFDLQKDTFIITDDSGVGMTKKTLSILQHTAKSSNEKRRLSDHEHSDHSRYQSPQLIEDEISIEAQEDAYNVFQVRDAVEDLDEGQTQSFSFPSSEELQSNIHEDGAEEDEASSNDSTDVQINCRKVQEICTPFALQENLLQGDTLIDGVHSTTSNSSTITSDIDDDDDASSNSAFENSEEQEGSVNEEEEEDEDESLNLPKSRGKKRAQSDNTSHDDTDVRSKFNPIFSAEDEEAKVKSTALRIVKGSQRRSYYPEWLSHVFHASKEDWDRKPTQAQLELLEAAILQSQPDFHLFLQLFQHVFGPCLCYKRENDVIQSIRNLYHLHGQTQHWAIKSGRIRSPAVHELTSTDDFIFIYLSSFTSSEEFFNYDCSLQELFPEDVLHSLHNRMAKFHGKTPASGYDYWAYARAKYLDDFYVRPMKPEDLTVDERKEWIQELEECRSFQEATAVTEGVFGPLLNYDDLPAPQVDIDRYWSPCECSICLRSNKRIKLDNANNDSKVITM
ncbi:hypothetical protein L7F22_019028 [Adiantum nelumboides]|nr:hypothetical protein [Adiantum nelumboides]